MTQQLVKRAAGIGVEFFEWVRDSLESEAARRAILADLGLPLGTTPPLNIPAAQLASISAYRDSQDVDFEAFLSTWGDIVLVLEALDAFVSAAVDGEQDVRDLTLRLINVMASDFFRLRYPLIYLGSRAADVIARRPEQLRRALELFEPGDDATLAYYTLMPLGVLLGLWELVVRKGVRLLGSGFDLPERRQLYGWDAEADSPTPNADALSSHMLSFAIRGQQQEPAGSVAGQIGATLVWVPAAHGGPGLLTSLHGSGEVISKLSDDWRLKVKFASSQAADFLIGDKVEVHGPSDASASATIETTRKTEAGPFILEAAPGTRLEIGKLTISASLGATGAEFKVVARDSALVLSLSDADAFHKKTIPANEVRFDFNLGLGLSNTKGLFLEGGSGLQLTIALNRTLGPVRLRQLHFAISGGPGANTLRISILATLEIKLGPIVATIDRIGFLATGPTPDRKPPVLGFQSPTGVGLVVDSEPVKGSGFLFHDASQKTYGGTLQLDIKGIVLSAIGLITNTGSKESPEYSLLIIITAEGFDWNVGFGFRLVGLGGLFGYNRTANVPALRDGLKNRSLDALLFPENPGADAPRIVSTLQTVMPARDGQFVGGVMAKFVWGVPTLLTLELGLIFEASSPCRLLLLGQLRVVLPHENHPLVRLQMDALGVVDWDRNEISLDAVLYDSHILSQVLTGDMALRARWAGDPMFLLAVGGWNPGFTAPADFPKLARLALTIERGDSARLRLEAYFALTTNTVQIGARAEFHAQLAGFSLDAHLGFDALLQFDPFHFVVEIKMWDPLESTCRHASLSIL